MQYLLFKIKWIINSILKRKLYIFSYFISIHKLQQYISCVNLFNLSEKQKRDLFINFGRG